MRILRALLPLAAVFSLAAQEAPIPRIAVFVPDQLIQKSVRGRQLFAELEVTKKNLEERLKAKAEEGQRLTAQLQSPSLSDSGKEQIQKQLRDTDYEFKKLQEDSQGEFQKVQQKVFGQFQQEVGPIVDAVAKEQKVQLVLQYSQGMIAYGEEGWMLTFTNEVAKRYDAKFASTTAPAAAPEKPAPKPTAKPAAPKGGGVAFRAPAPGGHRGQEELGDALPPGQGEGGVAVVDEHHGHLAPVIRVDGAGGVEDGDPVLEGQAGPGPHLAFVAGGDGHDQAGGHQPALPGSQGPGVPFGDGGPQIETRGMGRGPFRQGQTEAMGQLADGHVEHRSLLEPPT